MSSRNRSSATAFLLVLALAACSGDDPSDPGATPQKGSLRATVTGTGAGLQGVTVRLFADGGASPLASGSTAANGQFTFGDLNTGDYDVEVLLPAGWQLPAGATARRDVMVEANQTAAVTFALQEIDVLPTEGAARIRVVAGGSGVAGVVVALSESGGGDPVTSPTGSDGRVLFPGLTPGAYTAGITVPADYELAPGETNPRALTISAGAVTDATFEIRSTQPAVVEITASGLSFIDADVTITRGTTVRWIKGTNTHTVTPSGHSEWTAVTLDAEGETFEHVFENSGTFNYLCELHVGMTGVVRVQN